MESAIAKRKTPPGPQDTRVGMSLVWMNFPRRAPYQVYCTAAAGPRLADYRIENRQYNSAARIDYN